jgi:hypothetical protein
MGVRDLRAVQPHSEASGLKEPSRTEVLAVYGRGSRVRLNRIPATLVRAVHGAVAPVGTYLEVMSADGAHGHRLGLRSVYLAQAT